MSLKQTYDQIIRQLVLGENPIYDELTNMILGEVPRNMVELLTIFKQKEDIKMNEPSRLGTKQMPTTSYVFNLYSLHLVDNTIEAKEHVSVPHHDTGNITEGVNVLKKILKIITKLQESERLRLTKFIWSCQGFSLLATDLDLPRSGHEYMTDSIFSIISGPDYKINNMNQCIEYYEPMIDTILLFKIIKEDKWVKFVKYIEHFFDTNIGYTYDDPSKIGPYLSTFDYCVFVLNLLTKMMKKMVNSNEIIKILWKAIYVVYFQIPIMRHRIGSSINYTREEMNQTKNSQKKKELNDHCHKGIIMIQKLEKKIETIDHKYINETMSNKIQNIIDDKQYDIMHGLIESYSYWSRTLIKTTGIINILYLFMSSPEVPIQIKFNATCLLLSHNLRNDFFCYKNGKKVMIDYIINDVNRLKEINKLYLIDLVIGLIETDEIVDTNVTDEFVDTNVTNEIVDTNVTNENVDTNVTNEIVDDQIDSIALNHGINIMVLSLLTPVVDPGNPNMHMHGSKTPQENMCENMDILEKLLCVLPGIGGQYKESLKCLSFQHRDNQKIVNSLTRMIKTSTLMIKSLCGLGTYGLSYVDQLLEYVETIINTKKHLILEKQSQQPYEKLNSEEGNLLRTLETLEKKYIEMIKPMIEEMFNGLLRSKAKIIINKNTEKICVDMIGIKIPDDMRIIDYEILSQEYKDVITCDLVMNPYYITAGTDELFLIDRKTMLSLSETKINPFTREDMNRQMMEEFNNRPDIIEHKKKYMENIREL